MQTLLISTVKTIMKIPNNIDLERFLLMLYIYIMKRLHIKRKKKICIEKKRNTIGSEDSVKFFKIAKVNAAS